MHCTRCGICAYPLEYVQDVDDETQSEHLCSSCLGSSSSLDIGISDLYCYEMAEEHILPIPQDDDDIDINEDDDDDGNTEVYELLFIGIPSHPFDIRLQDGVEQVYVGFRDPHTGEFGCDWWNLSDIDSGDGLESFLRQGFWISS